MIFENLHIKRVVVHEVFQRADDRTIRSPQCAAALENLSPEAMGAFRIRLTDAMAGQTQSLKMRIAKHDATSFVTIAETLIASSSADFLTHSRTVATKLAEAQMARRIPGGMLIVFDGTVGANSIPLVGVIKAETQAGFRRQGEGTEAFIEFLQNIFLTPATRLYKVGIMARHDAAAGKPDGWQAHVFDSNISPTRREQAAAYFYEGFLGCAMPDDGPYETARFFDLTKDFVRKTDLDPEKKRDINDSLYVFVREQAPTFTIEQFGERHLPEEIRDTYVDYMQGKKFTTNAVVRDISQMHNRLRRRRLKFGSDVELSASPEALANKVRIEAIEGEPVDGVRPRWTKITIRDALTGEQ